MNILLLTSHSIAEYDDLRMLTDLGYDVFSIGAYTDPQHPTDDKRPALAHVRSFPELADRCVDQREKHADEDARQVIDWAKGDLHEVIIGWADVIIVHHFPETWIGGQWDRIRRKRVIWRTCGQSDPRLESAMEPFHRDGMEIVRYSPRERNLPDYAGEDALIRFGKYPDDYGPWRGDNLAIGNVTQDMARRGNACGLGFWLEATHGLPTMPAGPGSEALGGLGQLDYYEMLDYLAGLRVYLYTGTTPASYTLGLMEAMLSGTPVVSISASAFGNPELFEGDEIVGWSGDVADGYPRSMRQVAENTHQMLADTLRFEEKARNHSLEMRTRALELFDVAVVGPQWKAFLG